MEQLEMFKRGRIMDGMTKIRVKAGHRVYEEGTLFRGNYLPRLGMWEIYTLDGVKMGLLASMYAEEVND